MSQFPTELTKSPDQDASSDQMILVAAKGGGIAFAGNLFVYIIRFAFGVVIARLLGAALLGLYSLGTTFTDIAGIITQLGLGAGIARFIPIAQNQKDNLRLKGIIQIGIVIPAVAGVILALITFFGADLFSIKFYNQPALAPVLRLCALAIPLVALIGVLESITQGFKRMEFKVYSEDVTLNVIKLILTVAFVGAGFGVMGAVGASIASQFIACVMLLIFVNHLFPLDHFFQAAKLNLREMFSFTLPIYFSQFINEFSGSIGTIILGFFGTVSGVGIFSTALRVSAVGTLFHQSLMRIATPMISDLHSRGKISELEHIYQIMTKWGMAFNLPVFLTTAIFSKPLLSIFGQEFVEGSLGLIILAAAALFNASTGVCGTIVTMTGYSKLSLANSIIAVVVSIGLDLLIIPRWGLVGAAVATALAVIILNILRLAEIYFLHKIQPYNRTFLKPILAAIIASAIAFISNQYLGYLPAILQLVVGVIILWTTYVILIVILRLDDEDRLVLKRLWSRFSSR